MSFVLMVLVCYETFWHEKREYEKIPGSNYMAFVERIDHTERVGICDDNYVVFREAKYYNVTAHDGYLVAHDYSDNLVDIFTEDGDSILPEILKNDCYYYTADTIGYFIINNINDLEYVLITKTGQIVGPYPNMDLLPDQQLLLSRDSDCIRLFTYDGEEISPPDCVEAIFVEETIKQRRKRATSFLTAKYILTRCDSVWLKVSETGDVCDTIKSETVDSLRQNESFKMSNNSKLFEVKVSI